MKTYVTFGFDHTHEINGFTFDKDCVAMVEGTDASDARDNAFKAFGPKFCMEHPEEFFDPKSMKYFPRGIFSLAGEKQEVPEVKPWKRFRFYTKSVDEYRPLSFNPKFPWWCSGTGSSGDDEYAVIVAYLPRDEPIYKYWNDAYEVDFTWEDEITFSDRFPKPDYFEE